MILSYRFRTVLGVMASVTALPLTARAPSTSSLRAPATVKRDWQKARAYLMHELGPATAV